jgi:hypothetical protein
MWIEISGQVVVYDRHIQLMGVGNEFPLRSALKRLKLYWEKQFSKPQELLTFLKHT